MIEAAQKLEIQQTFYSAKEQYAYSTQNLVNRVLIATKIGGWYRKTVIYFSIFTFSLEQFHSK